MRFAVVVGALLVAPSALALGPVELDGAEVLPLDVTDVVPDAIPVVDGVDDLGGTVTRTVEQLTECRLAVQLDLHWWGGDMTDERFLDGDFLAVEEIVSVVRTEVPVYETFEETVWGPGGLFGLLKPVTKEVTRLTGYEVQEEEVREALDLALHLEWREEYIDWDHNIDTVWLTLPVGLPFVALDEGTVVEVCDDRPIIDSVPDPDAGDYEHYSPLPMTDGWFIDILGIDVALATPEQAALLPDWGGKGLLVSSGTVMDRVDREVATFVEDYVPIVAEPTPDESAPSDGMGPSSRLVVPVSTGSVLAGIIAAVAGLVATAGVLWRRR